MQVAVGSLLFELLTGTNPFIPDHDLTRDRIYCATLSAEPPSLASRGVSAPADLEALMRRLLAKHPSARPADAEEALHELLPIVARYAAEASSLALRRHVASLKPRAGRPAPAQTSSRPTPAGETQSRS